MKIENIYTVKVDTPLGPRYLVLAQTHFEREVFLKNDKQIPFFGMRTDGIMNPYGFATMDEIRHYYDMERYRKEDFPEHKNIRNRYFVKTSFYGSRSYAISFQTLSEMVLESLENPMTPEELFGFSPDVDIDIKSGEEIVIFRGCSFSEAAEKFQSYDKSSASLSILAANSGFVTKRQRKEMEKEYYLIRLNSLSPHDMTSYIKRVHKTVLYTTDDKRSAKQFKNENDAYKYVESHKERFGQSGYEVLEIKGMTLEDGMNIARIATL